MGLQSDTGLLSKELRFAFGQICTKKLQVETKCRHIDIFCNRLNLKKREEMATYE